MTFSEFQRLKPEIAAGLPHADKGVATAAQVVGENKTPSESDASSEKGMGSRSSSVRAPGRASTHGASPTRAQPHTAAHTSRASPLYAGGLGDGRPVALEQQLVGGRRPHVDDQPRRRDDCRRPHPADALPRPGQARGDPHVPQADPHDEGATRCMHTRRASHHRSRMHIPSRTSHSRLTAPRPAPPPPTPGRLVQVPRDGEVDPPEGERLAHPRLARRDHRRQRLGQVDLPQAADRRPRVGGGRRGDDVAPPLAPPLVRGAAESPPPRGLRAAHADPLHPGALPHRPRQGGGEAQDARDHPRGGGGDDDGGRDPRRRRPQAEGEDGRVRAGRLGHAPNPTAHTPNPPQVRGAEEGADGRRHRVAPPRPSSSPASRRTSRS